MVAVVAQEVRGRNREGDREGRDGLEGEGQVLQGLCHGKHSGFSVAELGRPRGAHLSALCIKSATR